jgi:dTDP-4-amino-4,6-dideoxygalactose transaminase
MDPVAADSLVSPHTTAVLVTHLSSSIADLDSFSVICERRQLAMIEDCSQAHGAVWRGQRVGSFGRTAAFSFQSSKLMTAGEGGVAVTREPELAEHLQQLRADGRQWKQGRSLRGFPDLSPGVGRQGHNHCMTEMQAAILSCALDELDAQNDLRRLRVRYLESRLEDLEGVRTLRRRNDPRVDRDTFWHLPIQIDAEAFGGASAEGVRARLSELAGIFLEPVGSPIPRHPLYRPNLYKRFSADHVATLTRPRGDLSRAERVSETCFTVPHHALLADENTIDQFVERLSALQHTLRLESPRA